MLLIILIFAIFVGLHKLSDNSFSKKILEAHDVNEAQKIRRRFQSLRIILLFAFFLTYVIVLFLSNFGYGEQQSEDQLFNTFMSIVLGFVLLFRFLKLQNKSKEYMGNISTITKSQFITQNEHFAIFLRGFEKDDYSKEIDLSKMKELKSFSEYKFMQLLQNQIPACAIGMTKETDSPYGATRLYVNDSSWKEEVKELMEKAAIIYILVNDKPSCIWEIEQSREMLEKTVFLIEERDKYENVRDNILHYDFLPSIPNEFAEIPHLLLSNRGGSYKFERFENSDEGYASALQISTTEKKRNAKGGCLPNGNTIIIIIIVSITFFYNYSKRQQHFDYYRQIGQIEPNNKIMQFEDIILHKYISEDESCSIMAPLGMERSSLYENQKIALMDNSGMFSISINAESFKDLKEVGVANAKEYAHAIVDFYKDDWETDSLELIEESNWSRGYYTHFYLSKRDELLEYEVYTLCNDKFLIQIVFAGFSSIYDKYAPEIEKMANSFTFN